MHKEILITKELKEKAPTFTEIKNGDTTKFICNSESKEVGFVSATLVSENTYDVGGMFVDPANRGAGISSSLVKLVNEFLERNNALGKLVNTIKGDSAVVYENNNWIKGKFKSHGAYGAYEYTYDCRK